MDRLGTADIKALVSDPERSAKAAGLRYLSDDMPGIQRKPWGRGFSYFGPDGRRISDPQLKARIAELAIPPAYEEVWISPYKNGHLQATGRDEKGRKQYIYHPKWRELRDTLKYGRMVLFGERLPELRAQLKRDMALEGLPREKVLATVVKLLETTLIRVGNAQYAKRNQSYGLTTIRKKHVEVDDAVVSFEFTGKGGQEWEVDLDDPLIAEVVRDCEDVPGYELFKYFDEEGNEQSVDAADVNDYLQTHMSSETSAKDFRTWAGTVLAAIALDEFGAFDDEAEAKKNVLRAIEKVAKQLGNTPTICRQSYVHPEVIQAYMDGSLRKTLKRRTEAELRKLDGLRPEEAAVLAFLKKRLELESSS